MTDPQPRLCDEVARERIAALDRRLTENLTALDRATQVAMTAAKEAVNKAEIASEKRFESVNEFRGQLADQAARFIGRAEVEAIVNGVKENIGRIDGQLANAAGRGAGAGDLWKAILAGVGMLLAAAGFVLALTGTS